MYNRGVVPQHARMLHQDQQASYPPGPSHRTTRQEYSSHHTAALVYTRGNRPEHTTVRSSRCHLASLSGPPHPAALITLIPLVTSTALSNEASHNTSRARHPTRSGRIQRVRFDLAPAPHAAQYMKTQHKSTEDMPLSPSLSLFLSLFLSLSHGHTCRKRRLSSQQLAAPRPLASRRPSQLSTG